MHRTYVDVEQEVRDEVSEEEDNLPHVAIKNIHERFQTEDRATTPGHLKLKCPA